MKTVDVIDLWRREVGDTSTPPLVSDDDACEFLTDAENEACRRARLIIDAVTIDICVIDVAPGEAMYELDQRVIRVLRAKADSRSLPLPKKTTAEMDNVAGWESHTGAMAAYLTDYSTGYIRFYRTPTAADTVLLRVHRLPLKEIVSTEEELEIHPRYHRALIHWMKYRYYSRPDVEWFDANQAATYLALFEQEFGPKYSALNEEFDERNLPLDNLDGSY